jgi:S-adenosylmethionine hydrolase
MKFVTLTTDFGNRDYYAGALKGAILQKSPDAKLVDITHEIKPYDIVHGAFVVANIWNEFPEGSIHLVGVNCVYQPEFRFVALRHHGHYFVAPDNGLLAILFPGTEQNNLRSVPTDTNVHFAVKHVFAAAVNHLIQGLPFDELGSPPSTIVERISLQPVILSDRIRGTVIHVDHFDNVVVNIRRELFDEIAGGRPFSLYFKRNDPITTLSGNYCDVATGEQLCLFNMAGFLEIAVNMGRAATLLGLKSDDTVEVVFNQE